MQVGSEHLTGGRTTAKPGKSRGSGPPSADPQRRALLDVAGAGVDREHESLEAGEGAVAGRRELAPAGGLVVGRQRGEDALVLWLTGELDRSYLELCSSVGLTP